MKTETTMHTFRNTSAGWIYKGEVDPATGETTFGELFPDDRVSFDFPSVDSGCESMPLACDECFPGEESK